MDLLAAGGDTGQFVRQAAGLVLLCESGEYVRPVGPGSGPACALGVEGGEHLVVQPPVDRHGATPFSGGAVPEQVEEETYTVGVGARGKRHAQRRVAEPGVAVRGPGSGTVAVHGCDVASVALEGPGTGQPTIPAPMTTARRGRFPQRLPVMVLVTFFSGVRS
ncbi:hypothetical protein Nans01_46220 [Nocardiopsis ansamitocini]|uniref:Uncharacterized protein n=1 Tax=Nocardiopsis ansamitocini TaxID=1670832 RepID=A0A9W6PB37_9ACTN|nr:hypothetical protein [Nocardiopsis ansamitocini]GLU50271.1 hypothetical protein Nans01_46220 [Nocardiopsis ansamitocini]